MSEYIINILYDYSASEIWKTELQLTWRQQSSKTQ